MNTLSWFIYFVDVFHTISIIMGVLSCASIALSLFMALFYILENDRWEHKVNKFIIGSFLALFVAGLFPSKNTMYAIAVSEMGEKAYKSELGVKGIKALEVWIDKQSASTTK